MVVLETPLVSIVHKDENLQLVEFFNIKEWYSLEEDTDVEFILSPEVKGSAFDWIGLFREDWNTFESFITFQQGLGKPIDLLSPRIRKVKFPFSKGHIDSILFDFKYQFVYINKYLDILGMSPLFKFILPLRSVVKGYKMLPSNKMVTLSEELLVSQNPYASRNYIQTCRSHNINKIRNTVTTCSQCKPCGHDYFHLKEKAEFCYLECLRLSDRLTDLECEVALHSSKFKSSYETVCGSDTSTQLSSNCNSQISSIDSMQPNSKGFHSIYDGNHFKNNLNHDINQNRINMYKCKDRSFVEPKVKHVKDFPISEDVIFRERKSDTQIRSCSYPPDSGSSKNQDLYSNDYLGLKKSLSDGKLNSNDTITLNDFDSPLIMKAIIGHQEEKIRKLTEHLNFIKNQVDCTTINEPENSNRIKTKSVVKNLPEECVNNEAEILYKDDKSDCAERDVEVVKLVRTEQRMLAQILRINSNCQEYTNEKE